MNIFKVGRLANAILGAWLFLSAMLIGRSHENALNAAVVGALCVTVALVSRYRLPVLRFLNIPLGVWLFWAGWARHGGTSLSIANDLLVATMIFGFACVPTDIEEDELRGLPVRA